MKYVLGQRITGQPVQQDDLGSLCIADLASYGDLDGQRTEAREWLLLRAEMVMHRQFQLGKVFRLDLMCLQTDAMLLEMTSSGLFEEDGVISVEVGKYEIFVMEVPS